MYSEGVFLNFINMANKKNLEQTKDLDEILRNIKSQFGQGSVMCLGEKNSIDLETFSSGSILLDEALGVGGYPKGRIIEIYGPESSGKTTLALTAVAEVQKAGGRCAYIDVENTIDPEYSQKIGIKINELVLSQPDSGEEAFEIAEALTDSGGFDLIVIDSVAALVPKLELEGMMSDSSVGLQARLMSKGLRKISGLLSKTKTTVIFINQLREKVGVIYGSNEITTGGRALKFYSTIRLDIRRSEAIKEGVNIIGNTVNIKVVKNKVAPPFKSCKLDLIYGKGFSKEGELLDLAVKLNLVKKSGCWYEYDGNRIGQGRETAKQFLKEHQDAFYKLKKEVLNQKNNLKMLSNENDNLVQNQNLIEKLSEDPLDNEKA